MNLRATLLAVLAMALGAALTLAVVQSRLGAPWLSLAAHPEVLAQLDSSMADLKRLAETDPDNAAEYRRRFAETERLSRRLRIVAHNRERLARRQGWALGGALALVLLATGSGLVVRQHRDQARLERLSGALGALAAGDTGIEIGDRRRDEMGTIAAMIERASRTMARDRRRLASLENLSAWQEAARRQAHELRTPLTTARLLLDRLERQAPGHTADAASMRHELERLAGSVERFAAFARLPAPRPEPGDLACEFAATFAGAWPGLTLRAVPAVGPLPVAVDRGMLRQVLNNLCANSAQATTRADGPPAGTVTLSAFREGGRAVLEVADDGPGIAAAVRRWLFEPYATTRAPGEGMGLGLAISRKILLDHGGELELTRTSDAGAAFRLLLPPALPDARAADDGGA